MRIFFKIHGVCGFVSEHVYAVLNAKNVAGKPMLTLRNPWGEVEPGTDGKDDGVFSIEASKILDEVATLLVA